MPCAAQDLPDPGRRLSREEMEADPDKRTPPKPDKSRGPRDVLACERARTYYTIACGAQDSRRSHGQNCGEAYALYRQACQPY